jgi:hypothetical protein
MPEQGELAVTTRRLRLSTRYSVLGTLLLTGCAEPTEPPRPAAPGITERARDVNLPPAMPTLGRPAGDRVSLEDPTSDFANAAIVAPPVKVPLAPASFLKVSLPDPFELGEQVKPKVPPANEPGLTPVPVNPLRIK